jgi:hypothetical protein
MILTPIEEGKVQSPWMLISQGAYLALKNVLHHSVYSAQEGINARGANGIFFIERLSTMDRLLLVKNKVEESRTKYRERKGTVEQELVYPLLRGHDVRRWYHSLHDSILVPYDASTGLVLSQDELKTKFSNSYLFLKAFEKELGARKHYGQPLENRVPFYTLFQVNKHSFAENKVVWKEISGKISGKGVFSAAVVGPDNGRTAQSVVIPDHKLMFVPCDSIDEAHFITSILNSAIVRVIVMSYTIETAISTHILEHVGVPKFDKQNPLHQNLSALSRQAHELATDFHERGNQASYDSLSKIDSEIDKVTAKLFNMTDDELNELHVILDVLKGEEIEGNQETEIE